MIPSLLSLFVQDPIYDKIFGASYYDKINVDREQFNYYYSCRFISNLMEKERVGKFITKWRFSIVPSPYMLTMKTLSYLPEYQMECPTGISKIEKNLLKPS